MTPAPAVVEQSKDKAWHNQSAEAVLAQLASTSEGLSSHEAAQRLAANGQNELKEGKRISPLQIFLGQFKSLLIWILIAAGVISGMLGEGVDAIASSPSSSLTPSSASTRSSARRIHRDAQAADRAPGQGATRWTSHFDSSIGHRRWRHPDTGSRRLGRG